MHRMEFVAIKSIKLDLLIDRLHGCICMYDFSHFRLGYQEIFIFRFGEMFSISSFFTHVMLNCQFLVGFSDYAKFTSPFEHVFLDYFPSYNNKNTCTLRVRVII